MSTRSTEADRYLAGLPEDRRAALSAVREVVLRNLDPAIEEGVQYGFIGYFVPHSVYPHGYHRDPMEPLPFLQLASRRTHMAIHAFCAYCDEAAKAWFVESWRNTGKKLDMGASCVRFKKLEDVPLDVVGGLVKKVTAKRFIKAYEQALPASVRANRAGTADRGEAPAKRIASTKRAAKKSPRTTKKR